MTKPLLAMAETSTAVATPPTWTSLGLRITDQPVAWAIIATMAAVAFLWCASIGLTITHWQLPAAISVVMLLLSAGYRFRNAKIAVMLEGAALWVAFSTAGGILTYPAVTIAKPLQDAVVANLDHIIGFDWYRWYETVMTHQVLHVVLWAAYNSLPAQILLTILVLPAIGKGSRSTDLVVIAAVALLLTILISALFPVIGPFGTYGKVHEPWLDHVLALRQPGPWSFSLREMQGIVTMPSYHTVLAILFCYGFRGTGWIGRCVVGLNVLMLLSIPPIGWHYIADMFIGGAVTLFCLVVVPPIMRSVDPWVRGSALPL